MVFLQSHGVSPALAVRIYKQYGDGAAAVVANDPYRLARDVHGIGFITADKIARNLGIASDAPERVAAGVAYALGQKADEGHVYVPQAELVQISAKLLEVPEPLVVQAIETLNREEQVHVEQASGRLALAEEQAVYLVPFYYGEIGVAGRLRRLIDASEDRLFSFHSFDWPQAFAVVQRDTGLALTPKQQEAVRTALTQRVVVLTGGPGTGKTTAMLTLIRLLDVAGRRYALASPTGRAAKRLGEATGREAKTIHRLLEFSPGGAGGFGFERNEDNPLEADMVIVDEASMLDLLLTNHLLKAISAGAHLLLVGDIDQLPPVGAGNVLRDIIDSGAAAVVRLDVVFRQAAGSYIIENAHRINHGQMPEWDPQLSDDFFLFQTEDPERAAELVAEIVQERVPRRFGIPSEDIQVLSPMHRGAVGVGALNDRLQETLNPPSPSRPERRLGGRVFRLGDRVMQIRNNYDKDVYNGDLGTIASLDPVEQMLTVRIEDRTVAYDFLELDELVARLRRLGAQVAGQRVPGGGHSCDDPALHDAAAQPALHRGNPGSQAGGAGGPAACDRDCRQQQPHRRPPQRAGRAVAGLAEGRHQMAGRTGGVGHALHQARAARMPPATIRTAATATLRGSTVCHSARTTRPIRTATSVFML